jgi:flagellar motor protein MotB
MRRLVLLAVLPFAVACGGALRGSASAMNEMDRVRGAAAVKEASSAAPEAVARAEEERKRALEVQSAGDEVAAGLHAERAMAAYQHAVAIARLARAKTDAVDATEALSRAVETRQKLALQRATVEREVEDLDKQLRFAREAAAPAPSGPADPQREAARLAAARALAMQARLLCGAARLVSTTVEGLAEAEAQLAIVEKQLEGAPKQTPIDAAARARAECLSLLTKARRSASNADGASADTLLAELSASGGLDPARDERGVVVALRGAFKGNALTPEAESKLKDLGRVAAAHAAWPVQVVLHDATPPSQAETAANAQRADAVTKALVAGGAAQAKVKSELAGAKAPVIDPSDAQRRSRNARVEIVFVAPN